ncbi:hypothetical protein H5410_057091 [Solanum commersonii]|uniref:Uncharacterized protein n=1 Tax=Solanum commersonii TaxID=4109 RepID=A0A9J5WNP5_SOLCO|nr:hypothetical protein H5410_057091 [Solanum commersonii]
MGPDGPTPGYTGDARILAIGVSVPGSVRSAVVRQPKRRAVVELAQNDLGCGTHFSSMRAPNGNFAFTAESEISFPIRFHISDSKANFKRISRESSGDLETRGRLRLSGEAFGDRLGEEKILQ